MATQTQPRQQAPPTPTQSETETPLLDRVIEETCLRLDTTATRYQRALEQAAGHTQRAILLGRGIQAIKALLTDKVMAEIMPLMDSPLGFLTDRPEKNKRNQPRYTPAEVRDALVQAILQGFYWTNNEFNIISGRFMGVLNGWKRKCEEVEGLTDLHVIAGIPRVDNGQTMVRVSGRWKLHGQKHELTGADGKPGVLFAVPSNEYATADAVQGKAKRRAYKLIYETVTGTRLTEPDDWADEAGAETPGVTAPPAPGRHNLRNGAKTPPEPTADEARADERAREAVEDLARRIDQAETHAQLQEIGADAVKVRGTLGEERYGAFQTHYQAKWRVIAAGQPARELGADDE